MNICLFTQEEIEKPLSLKDERGMHLIKILHKKEGDTFTAGIIDGKAGVATITQIDKDFLTYTFKSESEGKLLFPLKMIIGFPRPIQLKRLLRDIAGLGVSEVHLTGTELGEKSYMQSSLVEKGNAYKMLLDGTVQAGSTHVPKLFLHYTVSDCIKAIDLQATTETQSAAQAQPTTQTQSAGVSQPMTKSQSTAITPPTNTAPELKIALDNVDATMSLSQYLVAHTATQTQNIVAAIGSERGWTAHERTLLENAGYIRCSMGSRILRTETAATVSASIILSSIGALD